jgi:hypothetical protein
MVQAHTIALKIIIVVSVFLWRLYGLTCKGKPEPQQGHCSLISGLALSVLVSSTHCTLRVGFFMDTHSRDCTRCYWRSQQVPGERDVARFFLLLVATTGLLPHHEVHHIWHFQLLSTLALLDRRWI